MENGCEKNFKALEETLKKELKRDVQLCSLDMNISMLRDVMKITSSMLDIYNEEREIAKAIKLTLDAKYLPPWHCIIGRKFCSQVVFEEGYSVFFTAENKGFLIFRGRH
ncbi:Dynein light chain [Trichinella pseudospiralis]|uniref:Dynein light chain n=2 Tax=Trichinella pseudospiralis TaxID=6337 RepID=A0A0V1KG60_TRIPS|nr:Dynein light chain [Trichinella pseudospiralis]KRY78846.1 Dynein light chain [Trichinella pseudospiralis]KRY92356.1 Dynein light chain [Trichinella pseudospiralis]KRZ30824.1 Dynein light chain [Trichinella pseudospiralis]KRZ46208.1 Dynein light chain [Trichinella pseudospiralis]